jgi:hypothetical protein
MNKRDRKALGDYCRDLADALELRDWTVLVTVDEPDSPARPDGKVWQASSESTPGRKLVELTFAPDSRDWRLEALRSTVAHELIHAHFAPLIEMIRVDLFAHLGRPAYEIFCDGTTRWLEYGVDAMADATAKHLPLIEWPAAKRAR